MQIGVEVSSEVGKWLRKSAESLDYDKILDDAAELLLDRIQTRFMAEVDPDGKPWLPSRAAIRERRPTLYKTGKLFRSIRILPERGMERHIASVGVPYAIKHQEGIGVVKRRFLGFDRKGQDLKVVSAYVTGRIVQYIKKGK